MVEQIKDAVSETTSALGKGMAAQNPFLGFLLIVVVVFVGYQTWSIHKLNRELFDIKLEDQAIARDRIDRESEYRKSLLKLEELSLAQQSESEERADVIRKQFAESAKDLRSRLAAVEEKDDSQYQKSVEIVGDIMAKLEELDEQMKMMIQNQQLRSVIRAQPPQSQ